MDKKFINNWTTEFIETTELFQTQKEEESNIDKNSNELYKTQKQKKTLHQKKFNEKAIATTGETTGDKDEASDFITGKISF